MKNLIILTSLFLFSFTTPQSFESETLVKDCEFTVIVENDDGTETEYEITVHDISWWQCTKLQVGAWWDRNF